MSKPTLPCTRNVPRRFDEGKVDNYVYPSTLEDQYRQIYFEAVDLFVNYITDSFWILHISACEKSTPQSCKL